MEQAVLEHLLNQAEAGWAVHALSDDILALARTEIPAEPVRTLDAIHIASVLTLRDALGDLRVLSLDKRMRTSVSALGVRVLARRS